MTCSVNLRGRGADLSQKWNYDTTDLTWDNQIVEMNETDFIVPWEFL